MKGTKNYTFSEQRPRERPRKKGYEAGRDISIVHIFKSSDDLAGCHALGVQEEYLVVRRREASLLLFD